MKEVPQLERELKPQQRKLPLQLLLASRQRKLSMQLAQQLQLEGLGWLEKLSLNIPLFDLLEKGKR